MASASASSSPPTFFGALRETVRAAFGDAGPRVADDLLELLRQRHFREALTRLQANPRLWSIRDGTGCSVLHWAALGGSLELVAAGVAAGVAIDTRSQRRQTPLMFAACGGHAALLETLLAARAEATARDAQGATALILAVQQRKYDAISLLVERGGQALCEGSDSAGYTAAHWAADAGDLVALRLLDQRRIELASADASGMLPLHHASFSGRADAVDFLVKRRSDPAQRDAKGRSCVDIALECGHFGVQEVLLRLLVGQLLDHGLKMVAERNIEAASGDEAAGSADVSILQAIPPRNGVVFLLARDRFHAAVDLMAPPGCRARGDANERAEDRYPLSVECAGLARDAKIAAQIVTKLRTNFFAGADLVLARVPSQYRWSLWKAALKRTDHDFPRGSAYRDLSRRTSEWSDLIRNDVNRTFMDFNDLQLDRLSRLLNAYAAYRPEVGYCQGMNFVAGVIVRVGGDAYSGAALYAEAVATSGDDHASGGVCEEEAFGVFVGIMDHLGLCEFYRDGFPLLRRYVDAIQLLMRESVPDLCEHFERESVEPAMYLQQWLLTLFVDCLPMPLVVVIWDAIVFEGLEVVLRVALVLLQGLREALLSMGASTTASSLKAMRGRRGGGYSSATSGGPQVLLLAQLLLETAGRIKVPAELECGLELTSAC